MSEEPKSALLYQQQTCQRVSTHTSRSILNSLTAAVTLDALRLAALPLPAPTGGAEAPEWPVGNPFDSPVWQQPFPTDFNTPPAGMWRKTVRDKMISGGSYRMLCCIQASAIQGLPLCNHDLRHIRGCLFSAAAASQDM